MADTLGAPLRPQMVGRAVSDLLAPNAIIAPDSGANTHFAARCVRIQADQKISVSGKMASMASGLPFAIAAQLTYPGRQCVAIVGDGGSTLANRSHGHLNTAPKTEFPPRGRTLTACKRDLLAGLSSAIE